MECIDPKAADLSLKIRLCDKITGPSRTFSSLAGHSDQGHSSTHLTHLVSRLAGESLGSDKEEQTPIDTAGSLDQISKSRHQFSTRTSESFLTQGATDGTLEAIFGDPDYGNIQLPSANGLPPAQSLPLGPNRPALPVLDGPDNTFWRFTRLPLEIQYKIIRHALLEPGVCDFYLSSELFTNPSSKTPFYTQSNCRSSRNRQPEFGQVSPGFAQEFNLALKRRAVDWVVNRDRRYPFNRSVDLVTFSVPSGYDWRNLRNKAFSGGIYRALGHGIKRVGIRYERKKLWHLDKDAMSSCVCSFRDADLLYIMAEIPDYSIDPKPKKFRGLCPKDIMLELVSRQESKFPKPILLLTQTTLRSCAVILFPLFSILNPIPSISERNERVGASKVTRLRSR